MRKRFQEIKATPPLGRQRRIRVLLCGMLWCMFLGFPGIGNAQGNGDICDNVVYPGEVGYDQYLCGPGNDPEPFVNIRAPYGGKGEIEYVWMKSEVSADFGTGGFKEIPNSNSLTYDSGPLEVTTYFARCVRRKGCEDYVEANILKVTVGTDASANIIGPSPVCFSDETIYSVETTTPDAQVVWTLPAGVNANTRTGKTIRVTFDRPGRYTFEVSVNENDCSTGGALEIFASSSYLLCNEEEICGEAAFDAPSLVCDGRTVKFDNKTKFANNFEWTIETASGTLTSTDRHPTFTFPEDGTYTVSLVSEKNTNCESSISKTISIGSEIPGADFRVDLFECPDSAFLYLSDLTLDPNQLITSWNWTVETNNGFVASGNTPLSIIAVPLESQGMVTLELGTADGCSSEISKNYITGSGLPDSYLADTLKLCVGDTIALNPLMPEDVPYAISWSGPGITNPAQVNPIIVVSEGETIYTAVITGPKESCEIRHDIVVIGGLAPDLDFSLRTTCNGLEFTIENTSRNADSFEWIIGDLNDPIFTSREAIFDFTFPDEGICPIYLIGTSGCIDTLSRIIDVDSISLAADFTYDYLDCQTGSVDVQFSDQSVVDGDTLIGWEWLLPDGRFSSEQSPVFNFTESGIYAVQLEILGISGCADTIVKNIKVTLLEDVLAQIPDTLIACGIPTIQLDSDNDPGYTYEWFPEEGLDDPTSPNPVFTQSGSYTVIIGIPRTDGCSEEKQIAVTIGPAIELSVDGAGATCESSRDLVAITQSDAEINWYLGDQLLAENTAIYTVTQPGANTFTAIATSTSGCMDTVSVAVDLQSIDISFEDQVFACLGEPVSISISNNNPDDVLEYVWSPAELVSGGQGTATANISAPIGINQLFLTVRNQNDCERKDTIDIVIVDPDNALGFEIEPLCEGTLVRFKNTSERAFGYLWNFGDPDNPDASSTAENPSYNYPRPGTYTATLTTQYDVSCRDTVQQTFTIETDQPFQVDFDYELVECRPGSATVRFINLTNSTNPNLQYEYLIDGMDRVRMSDFEIDILEYGVKGVTLNVFDEDGCSGTLSKFIKFPVVEIDLPDTIALCESPSVTLNPDGNAEYEYQWSGLGIVDPSSPSQTLTPTESSTYSVTITAFGFDTCSVVDEVYIVVPTESLQVNIPAEINTCGAATITATVLGTARSLIWQNADGMEIGRGTSIEVEPLQEANYYLLSTDQFGCTQLDSTRVINQGVNLSIDPGTNIEICGNQELAITLTNLDEQDTLSYNWQPEALLLSGQGTPNPIVSVQGMNMDQVMITAFVENQFDCRDTIEFTISIGELMVDLPDTIKICNNDPVGLGPDADASFTYVWSPVEGIDDPTSSNPIFTGTSSTQYFVTVTDPASGENCSRVDTVQVIVGGNFELTKQTTVDTICAGKGLELELSTEENVSVSWYKGDEFTDLNEMGTVLMVVADPGDNVYHAIGTDNAGCMDTLRFEFQGISSEDLGLDTLLVGCIGEQFELYPDANPNYIYQWAPANLLEDPTAPNPTTLPLNSDMIFMVTITIPGVDCELEGEVKVDVEDDIILSVTPDTTICGTADVTLKVSVDTGTTVEWKLDDGTVLSTDTSFVLTVDNGSVEVFVEATTEEGCMQEERILISVLDFDPGLKDTVEVCIGVPTAINPDGDPNLEYVWMPDADLDFSLGSHNPRVTLSSDQVYQVRITDTANGCVLTDSIYVAVIPIPTIETMNDTAVCLIGPFQVSAIASDFVSITWYNRSGNNLGSGLNVTVNLEAGENTFYAEAQNKLGCTAVDTLIINATDFATGLSLDAPVEVCANIPTEINPNGNPAYIYEWDPTTGLDLTNPHNPIATLSADLSYGVTVTDTLTGCVLDTILEVQVRENISLTEVTNDTTLCGPTTLTLSAQTNLPSVLEWFSDAQMTQSLGTGNTLEVTPVEGTNTYYVKTDDAFCIDANDVDTITVIVEDFETGLSLDAPVEICADIPTEINPNGNPAYIYEWDPTTGLDLTNPHNPIATLSADQTYGVTVTDTITGCVLDTILEVQVRENISLTEVSNDTTLCGLNKFTLTATTNLPSVVEWFADGNLTRSLGTGNEIEVTLSVGRSTFYVKTDDEFCIDGNDVDTITIIVEDFDTGLSLDNPGVEICADIPTEINPNGNPAYVYEWNPTTGLDLTNPHNPIATLSADQTYGVTVTDTLTGCVLDTILEVRVRENISLTEVTNDTTLCGPATLTLSAQTNLPSVLEWFSDAQMTQSLGTGNTLEVMPEEGTNTYYVKTDDEFCIDANDVDTILVERIDIEKVAPDSLIIACRGDLINLNPQGDRRFIYSWTPIEGLSDPNAPNPSFQALEDQELTVAIYSIDSVCTITRTVIIELDSPLELEAGPDTVLCSTGVYQLVATATSGNDFKWATDRDFSNVIATELTVEIDLVPGGQYYYVMGTNDNDCNEVDSVFVGSGLIDARLPEQVIVCDDDNGAVLTVENLIPEQELMYLWTPETKLEDETKAVEGPSAILKAGEGGQIMVMLENQFGCTLDLTTTVIVDDISDVNISASATTVKTGNPVDIMVTGCIDCTYEWEPADQVDNPNSSMVMVQPTDTTTYFVTVRRGECERILEITINVDDTELCSQDNIFIPNAFTPNGDNENDILFVRSNVIEEMHFIIYNRWGQEVFDTRVMDRGWDGTFRGRELPPDVYGYYLEARCIGGTEAIVITGNVSLLR